MKRFLITSILAAMVAVGTALMAQDYPDEYLGLPGDNFNLYAVMNLFQQSETIEAFERSLNDENTRINNLDLNNDNLIDYIKVLDFVDGNVHTIVLQAQLDRNDNQDVAVFTVQKLRDGEVQIQLIGDEALYGRNYIVEPIYAETPNPGYTGRSAARSNRQNVTVVRTTYVEVAAWPLVRYIYLPDYRIWRSSWYWGYYPSYWSPWRPYYYHYYYGYHYNWYPTYYSYYHRYDRPRYDRWNDFYYRDKRVYSRNVTSSINEGRYKTTYSRPESRRDGEALYAKVHPDRASSITTGTTGSRRSASQAGPTREAAGTNNASTRRSTGTVNQNAGTRSDQSQGNSGNARRSTTTVNRSTTTVNSRDNTNPTAGQSAGTNRRSSETVSTKSSTGSQSTRNAEPARTTRQKSSGESQAVRRSTERAQKETTVRQGSGNSTSSNKESETKSSRRK